MWVYSKDVTIVSADYHRNGVGSAPFYAILFDDAKQGRMLACLFEDPAHCAVVNVEKLADGDIRFGSNSWRGDAYAHALRPKLDEYLKAKNDVPASIR